MTLSDRTLSFELPKRKSTYNLTVNDTTIRCNKSTTKHEKIKEKQKQTQIGAEKPTLLENKIKFGEENNGMGDFKQK